MNFKEKEKLVEEGYKKLIDTINKHRGKNKKLAYNNSLSFAMKRGIRECLNKTEEPEPFITLSDKITDLEWGNNKDYTSGTFVGFIHRTDVSEFIKRLKEELFKDPEPCCLGIRPKDAIRIIDKLVGEKLT